MKHTVVRIDNLMYKGCEPHWKCTKCGVCIPFHCYKKQEIEEMECNADTKDLARYANDTYCCRKSKT